jgi:hypothetical protein
MQPDDADTDDNRMRIDKTVHWSLLIYVLVFVSIVCFLLAGAVAIPASSVRNVLDASGNSILDQQGMPLLEHDPWGSFMINIKAHSLLFLSALSMLAVCIIAVRTVRHARKQCHETNA